MAFRKLTSASLAAVVRREGIQISSFGTTTPAHEKFLNRVQLLGRIGRQPAPIGNLMIFPIYTENVVRNQSDELKVYPAWHRIIVPSKRMFEAVKRLDKGCRVYIEGRLSYRTAEYNYRPYIVCDQLILVARREQARDQDDEPIVTEEEEIEMPKEETVEELGTVKN